MHATFFIVIKKTPYKSSKGKEAGMKGGRKGRFALAQLEGAAYHGGGSGQQK